MAFDLGSVLSQFTGGNNAADVQGSYQAVATNAPQDLVSRGLAAMFNSSSTPPFGQMAGQLFSNAAPHQQAGMLSQLLSSMGPSVIASLAGSAGGGALGSILGRMSQPGAQTTVTPDEAAQVTPQQVDQIASHAQQNASGVVETMSDFYAQHPTLVKTLGGAALSIAMAKMAESHA